MQDETSQTKPKSTQELTESQRFWFKHCQACQASGEVMADYAREHGLVVKSFYYWRKRLIQLGVIGPESPSTSPFFHKVQIKPVQVGDPIHCHIRFPNGVACEMMGMDAQRLDQLLMSVSRLPQ